MGAFRSHRTFAELPTRPAAWDSVEKIVMGGFSLEKAKLVYASWRLVKLAQRGARLSGDPRLLAERIAEFQRRLAEFLA